MNRVWLASYPKSGSTWFRLLIAARATGPDRPFDINALAERSRLAAARQRIDNETLIDTALLTHDEADVLRARFFEHGLDGIERGESVERPVFYKVHDAWRPIRDGSPTLGRDTADRAIVLVRDPRDIALSFAAHLNQSVDWTIAFMADARASMGGDDDDRLPSVRQRLGSWSGHVAGWLGQRDLPVHVVKYEALTRDPVGTFIAAMRFAGRTIPVPQAERAVALTRFEHLQDQEREHGFVEAPAHGAFFGQGRSGRWREELSRAQRARIEQDHAATMRRLGYQMA